MDVKINANDIRFSSKSFFINIHNQKKKKTTEIKYIIISKNFR